MVKKTFRFLGSHGSPTAQQSLSTELEMPGAWPRKLGLSQVEGQLVGRTPLLCWDEEEKRRMT